MSMLFVADLHYALRQFDWLAANAARYDPVIIGGDLLDIAGALDLEVQIVVIEKYLERIRQQTRLVVSSGNHDGDSRPPDQARPKGAAAESIGSGGVRPKLHEPKTHR